MNKEIKKIEELLAKEKNLNQISFYEGYLKGLKYRQKELLEKIEDIPIKYPEFESDWYDQGNQDMKNKIKKIIKEI